MTYLQRVLNKYDKSQSCDSYNFDTLLCNTLDLL